MPASSRPTSVGLQAKALLRAGDHGLRHTDFGLADGARGFHVDDDDANKQRSIPGSEWNRSRDPATANHAVKEYLARLDDAVFGAASDVIPKFVSPSDPAAQWTGAMRGPAFFAYADNYLIDVSFGTAGGRHGLRLGSHAQLAR